MSIHLKNNYYAVLTLTGLFLFIGLSPLSISPLVELGLFVIIMLITGIPHGATDHILYIEKQSFSHKKVSLFRFILTYLIVMFAYAIAWYFFPVPSLILFLIISAYHFGQSQFVYLPLAENHIVKLSLYFLWGSVILSTLIFWNWQESIGILTTLIPEAYISSLPILFFQREWVLFQLIGISLLILLCRYYRWMNTRQVFFEMLNLALLLSLFHYQSLLIGFAIYFGLWHAISSIITEIRIFNQLGKNFTLHTFIQQALLFSLISFAGIGLLLGISYFFQAYISPYLLFFIAISTLTLPHIIYIQQFYTLGKVFSSVKE